MWVVVPTLLLLHWSVPLQSSITPCQPAPSACVFPFTYQGQNYSTCIREGSQTPWCATIVTATGFQKRLLCENLCPENTTEDIIAPCQPLPEACVFPFIYQGQKYTTCIKAGSQIPWCATAVNAAGYYIGQRIPCENLCPENTTEVFKTSCQPAPEVCVFPFIYQGQKYTTCIKAGSRTQWCATAVNATGYYIGQRIHCENMCSENTTEVSISQIRNSTWDSRNRTKGNGYIHHEEYRQLQGTGHTLADHESRNGSGHQQPHQKKVGILRIHRTEKKHASCQPAPAACVFPFIFKGHKYTTCIKAGSAIHWCATEVNGTGHYIGKRMACENFCKESSSKASCQPAPAACVFPFIFKGHKYSTCIKAGSKIHWCATAVNGTGYYIGKRMKCEQFCKKFSTKASCQPAPAACVFPFIFKGHKYTTCIKAGSAIHWCATEVNGTGHYIGKRMACENFCRESSSEASCQPAPAACVFPFIFKGHKYSTCIKADSKIYWCATTVNGTDYYKGNRMACENFCEDNNTRGSLLNQDDQTDQLTHTHGLQNIHQSDHMEGEKYKLGKRHQQKKSSQHKHGRVHVPSQDTEYFAYYKNARNHGHWQKSSNRHWDPLILRNGKYLPVDESWNQIRIMKSSLPLESSGCDLRHNHNCGHDSATRACHYRKSQNYSKSISGSESTVQTTSEALFQLEQSEHSTEKSLLDKYPAYHGHDSTYRTRGFHVSVHNMSGFQRHSLLEHGHYVNKFQTNNTRIWQSTQENDTAKERPTGDDTNADGSGDFQEGEGSSGDHQDDSGSGEEFRESDPTEPQHHRESYSIYAVAVIPVALIPVFLFTLYIGRRRQRKQQSTE